MCICNISGIVVLGMEELRDVSDVSVRKEKKVIVGVRHVELIIGSIGLDIMIEGIQVEESVLWGEI